MSYIKDSSQYSKEMPYFSFREYTREKFNTKVAKVSINIADECDYKLKTGGCIYCETNAYTPNTANHKEEILKQWENGANFRKTKYDKFYAYFQLGTNTSINSLKSMMSKINPLLKQDNLIGFMIGTRVDYLDNSTISFLNEIGSSYDMWLELGLQSTNDDVLKFINRGHTYADFTNKLDIISGYQNINVATHIILGLPNESKEEIIGGIKKISKLPLAGVKYHHLEVVKGSQLAKVYDSAPFNLFSREEYEDFITQVVAHTNPRFVVERLVGESAPEHLIAPKWDIPKTTIIQNIRKKMIARSIFQGMYYN